MSCFGLCVQLRWITWLRMWACPRREGWSSESTRLCSDCYRWRRDRRIDGSRTEHPPMCFTSIPPFFLQRPHADHLTRSEQDETKRNFKIIGSLRLSTYSSVNTKAIPHKKQTLLCRISLFVPILSLFHNKETLSGLQKEAEGKWASIVWSQITKALPVGIQC